MPRLNPSAIAALFLALSAYPASADPGVQIVSVKVAYSDLDLSGSADAETLLGRMRKASFKVCGAKPSPRELRAIIRQKECVESAMSVAVANVNAPLVTALFQGERGRQTVAVR